MANALLQGMNFTEFWSVNNNSDVFFWELAIPIIVAVTAVFMWGDFVRIFHYLQKRWIARNAVKVSPMGNCTCKFTDLRAGVPRYIVYPSTSIPAVSTSALLSR